MTAGARPADGDSRWAAGQTGNELVDLVELEGRARKRGGGVSAACRGLEKRTRIPRDGLATQY